MRWMCDECETADAKAREEKAQEALRGARTQLIRKWLVESGIPARYQCCNFASFRRELQPNAYDMAYKYVEPMREEIPNECNDGGTCVFLGDSQLISTDALMDGDRFPHEPVVTFEDCDYMLVPHPEGASSLMLSSTGNGTGKTHLAVAVAGRFMRACVGVWFAGDSERSPVLFTTVPKMLLRIRGTYRDDAAESETDIINEISTVNLLVLDDVGKEKPSDHTRQTYFTIIDGRYGANLPIVLTSNFILPKQAKELNNILGEASMSRLKEMTEGWRVVLDGEDYRYRVQG